MSALKDAAERIARRPLHPTPRAERLLEIEKRAARLDARRAPAAD